MWDRIRTIREKGRAVRECATLWFETHGIKLGLSIGALLSIALAFESGFLAGRERRMDPLVVSVPAPCSNGNHSEVQSALSSLPDSSVVSAVKETEGNDTRSNASPSVSAGIPKAQAETATNTTECAFVGSRNSDKYHLPKCSWAKRIKPENRICFASAADAESKGYVAGCVK